MNTIVDYSLYAIFPIRARANVFLEASEEVIKIHRGFQELKRDFLAFVTKKRGNKGNRGNRGSSISSISCISSIACREWG